MSEENNAALDWRTYDGTYSHDTYWIADLKISLIGETATNGSLCVGYVMDEKELTINFNYAPPEYSMRGFNESMIIRDGKIVYLSHKNSSEMRDFCKEIKPAIIIKSLERILETIPDENVKILYDMLGEGELKKLELDKYDNMFNNPIFPDTVEVNNCITQ